MSLLLLANIYMAFVMDRKGSAGVAACYRRMDVVLADCKAGDSLDFRAYNKNTTQWTLHANLNCFSGHGAKTVPGPDPYPSGTSDPDKPWIPKQQITLQACKVFMYISFVFLHVALYRGRFPW